MTNYIRPNKYNKSNEPNEPNRLHLYLIWLLVIHSWGVSQEYTTTLGQAESSFGFSPQLFLHQPEKSHSKVYGQVRTSLPIKFSNPLDRGIQQRMNEHPMFSSSQTENYSALMTQIEAGMPLYDGNIHFSYSENLNSRYLLESPRTTFQLDTIVNENETRLNSTSSSAFLFEQSWKTLSLAYTLHLEEKKYLGFRIHKHLFQATSNGNMKGIWQGSLNQVNGDLITQYPINYTSDQFFTSFDAQVSGSGWSPEFKLRWGRWKFQSVISVNIPLEGNLRLNQRTPFFLDSLTHELAYTPEELFDESQLLEAQSGTIRSINRENQNLRMRWQTPEVHTLSFEAVRDHIDLSFTWFRQQFALNNESESTLANYVDWSFKPEYNLAANVQYKGFYSQMAWMIFDYSQSDPFFQEVDLIRLSQWLDYGQIPYLNLGANFGEEIILNVEVLLLPTNALSIGVRYEI